MKNILNINTNNKPIICLDDSDKNSSIFLSGKKNNSIRDAENILRNWALDNNYFILITRGFSPTHLFVKEGIFAIPINKKYKKLLSNYVH